MRRLSLEVAPPMESSYLSASYAIPVDLAIGLMLATELEHPLLVPHVSHSRPRGLTSDESMLLAEALAFLEGLWRATRSPHSMAVWRVGRWLRDHRLTIAQFQEFLAREKAVPHPIEDSRRAVGLPERFG